MRKKIILAFILLMPFIVKANSITINCPEKIKAGQEGSCTITGTATQEITAISATINISSNLSIVSFSLDELWQGEDIDDGKIDSFTSSGDTISADFSLGTLVVKANDNTYDKNESVGLTSILFLSDDNDYTVDDASDNIRIPSNDSTLKELRVEDVLISPEFDPNVTKYTGSTQESAVTVVAVPNHRLATISKTGLIDLKTGKNEINVTVTAEDGSTKTYRITLTADIYEPTNPDDPANPDEPTPSNPSDKTDEDIDSNISTGSSYVYLIIAIGIIAIVGMTLYYRKLISKK